MPSFVLPDSEPSFAAALPSTVLHGLLIAAAIAAARPSDPGIIADDLRWEDIVLGMPVPPTRASPVTSDIPVLPGAPIVSVPMLPDLPGTEGSPVIPGIPVLDPTRLIPGDPHGPPCCEMVPPGTTTGVYVESEVDDGPVLLVAGAPRYPTVLREAGINGRVTLAFVIDRNGRVEPDGIEVLSATHNGFIAAATEAVLASRFTPARRHGETVRVRVRQTVVFRA